jgi:hypothetical protein
MSSKRMLACKQAKPSDVYYLVMHNRCACMHFLKDLHASEVRHEYLLTWRPLRGLSYQSSCLMRLDRKLCNSRSFGGLQKALQLQPEFIVSKSSITSQGLRPRMPLPGTILPYFTLCHRLRVASLSGKEPAKAAGSLSPIGFVWSDRCCR